MFEGVVVESGLVVEPGVVVESGLVVEPGVVVESGLVVEPGLVVPGTLPGVDPDGTVGTTTSPEEPAGAPLGVVEVPGVSVDGAPLGDD